MKNYLVRPELLLFFVYLTCFAVGILCFFTEMDTLSLLDQFPDICIFKRLTGFKCPGCGMTHAFVCLGRFQLGEAIRHNVFSVFLFYGGLAWLIHPKGVQIRVSNRIMVSLLVLVIIYGVIRNMNLIS